MRWQHDGMPDSPGPTTSGPCSLLHRDNVLQLARFKLALF